MGYAGCGSGQALADLLTGYAEPTGRLAFTWPAACDEAGAFTPAVTPDLRVVHRESFFAGYRYYDTANAPVAFPFGHGVGYAHFAFPSMRLIATEAHYVVECAVRNTSDRDGVETVQVYVHALSPSHFKPYQVLAGFAKVAVAAGETETVRIELDDAAFSFWDASSHGWVIEEGPYEILVGTSSRAVRLAQTFTLVRTACPDRLASRVRLRSTVAPARKRALLPYYRVGAGFTDEAFRTLYGGPLPEARPEVPVTLESPIAALGRTQMGKRMRDSLLDRVARTLAHGEEFAIDEVQTPLRALLAFGLPRAELEAAAHMANGKVVRGAIDYLRAWMRTWGSR
jgi:beta-glucosidase